MNHDQPDHDKLDEPVCDACAFGMDEIEARQKECMKKYGWYAHAVMDDSEAPYNYNVHTHGLTISAEHSDLQICCPIPPEVAHSILATVAENCLAGSKFRAGDRVEKIIQNYRVLFVDATECDRPVLRVILPDPTGCLDKDEMESDWALQYNGTKPLT